MRRRSSLPILTGLLLAVSALACGGDGSDGDGGMTSPAPGRNCVIDQSQLQFSGVGQGGIPALTNPDVVPPGGSGIDFLTDATRVVGVVVDGEALAVPFNILWWHEVVNFDRGDEHVVVTRCPITGSSLAFRREVIHNRTFEVSGLLFLSNLVLSTGGENPTLFPQMSRAAGCGPERGTPLESHPMLETAWGRWKELHPDTRVVSSRTGHDRGGYTISPYSEDYDDPQNSFTVVSVPELDPRRPPKEVVLGIPSERSLDPLSKNPPSGLALPFGELEERGESAAVEVEVGFDAMVVLWEAASRTAAAYTPEVSGLSPDDPAQGRELSFEVVEGEIRDVETGSRWRVDGRAVGGPLTGARLEPVSEAFTAYWYAWALFHPATEVWETES